MLLLDYFRKESTASMRKLLFMAVVSGIANGVILMLINVSAENAWNDEANYQLLVLYILALAIFAYTKKYAMDDATAIVEQVIRDVRVRVADKIRHADLPFVEQLGMTNVYATVAQDTNLISQTAIVMIHAASSGIMLLASLIYIGLVSMTAFIITLISILLAVSLYLAHRNELLRDVQLSNDKEAKFFNSLDHILRGFKELKVNFKKSRAVFDHLRNIADETEALKVKTGLRITVDYMFSQVFYYSLLAIIIFALPHFDKSHAPLIMKLTAAILFIIGPLDTVVGSFPLFARSTVAIENIIELEDRLDKLAKSDPVSDTYKEPLYPFSTIELNAVEFEHKNQEGETLFTLGPIDLRINQGEILFVIGGNGSGKSTMLKVLTGLYHLTKGEIKVDGKTVTRSLRQNYRELFSVVFTDFHLFDRLYGLEKERESLVNTWLEKMEIANKTDFHDGKFTNLRLSTGQRKRLALIVSFLEDKDICIFDECAADQDPEFKNFFYTVLLQQLQSQGKTIIVVSHDDHYFSAADRVVKMNFGRLEQVQL